MENGFVDLGAGWFLFEDEESRCSVICDSQAGDPDLFFGPAAWQGKSGPLSGRAILEARPVARGAWQQTGPDDWRWFAEDGKEYDEPPASWPRVLEPKTESSAPLVQDVSGRRFDDSEELVDFLRALAQSQIHRTLVLSTEAERLEAATNLLESFNSTRH